jgi:hypothetical protein
MDAARLRVNGLLTGGDTGQALVATQRCPQVLATCTVFPSLPPHTSPHIIRLRIRASRCVRPRHAVSDRWSLRVTSYSVIEAMQQ